MRILTYQEQGKSQIGVVRPDGVAKTGLSAQDFYARGLDALAELNTAADGVEVVQESSLLMAPVVPDPGKIICVGLNYRHHAREIGKEPPEFPVLFAKFRNALAADGEDVPVAASWTHVDYEAELGVVIGAEARGIDADNALSVVMGYFCANDISERQLQNRTGQWLAGKTPDKFLPIGSHLVTADTVPDPQALTIRGWLNDDLRQDKSTSDMIFSVAEIIAYASEIMTLMPGDIIMTGTPEGVAAGRDAEAFLKPGDRYTVEIEGVGRLSNRIVLRD